MVTATSPCPRCRKQLTPTARFCPRCGMASPVSGPPPFQSGPPPVFPGAWGKSASQGKCNSSWGKAGQSWPQGQQPNPRRTQSYYESTHPWSTWRRPRRGGFLRWVGLGLFLFMFLGRITAHAPRAMVVPARPAQNFQTHVVTSSPPMTYTPPAPPSIYTPYAPHADTGNAN
jgi:hypothetical protein